LNFAFIILINALSFENSYVIGKRAIRVHIIGQILLVDSFLWQTRLL